MKKSRYENLDALRALAVVSVLLYHYTARFPDDYTGLNELPFHVPYGWLGVEAFFVLSGYCISMTLGKAATLVEFWAKRIARIQPAYMAAILLTFACVSLVGLPGRESSALSVAADIFWLNAVPQLHIRDVDPVYWSLVVELKFYFWVGLTATLFGKNRLPAAWGVFCFIGWLAGRFHPSAAEYLLIASFAPMFLFGITAFYWKSQSRWLSLALVAEAAALTFYAPRFIGFQSTGCMVGVGTMALTTLTSIRVPRPVTWLGAVSYPLYLVHQNIGLLVIRGTGELHSVVRILVACLIVIALAALIHYLIEFRFQKPLTWLFERMLATYTVRGLKTVVREPAGETAAE
jgi:peptidoglycan/LPS O-acetylase OafA/YrhL